MATKAGGSTETFTMITCSHCGNQVSQPQGTRRTICPYCGSFFDHESNGDDLLNPQSNSRSNGNDKGVSRSRPPRPPNGRQTPGEGRSRTHRGHPMPPHRPTGVRIAVALGSNGVPDFPRRGSAESVVSSGRPKYKQKYIYKYGVGRSTVNSSRRPLQGIANFFSNLRGKSAKKNGNGHHTDADSPQLPPLSPQPSYLTASALPTETNLVKADSHPALVCAQGIKVLYPVRPVTIQLLNEQQVKAQGSGDWTDLIKFFAQTFSSFLETNAVFKRDVNKEYRSIEDSGIKSDLLATVYDILNAMPQDQHRPIYKSIINSLLQKKQNLTNKDDLRAYLILLQNPLFEIPSSFLVFAHLLRCIASLTDYDHHYLVHWIRKLAPEIFTGIVHRLQNFISLRLFPPRTEDLPPLSKCTWWIPSAVKVLALLNAANGLCSSPKLQYFDFYNHTLDHLDLMAEYYAWQNPTTHPGFTFCQYPFILSIQAKRMILQRDSEQQMIIMARRSLVKKVQRRQTPDIGMLFLNLTVRRAHLVADSLEEIARKKHDLKKKLRVTFSGEPGLDMGGLTKEWFLLLVRKIFRPEYGMFTYDSKARSHWFALSTPGNKMKNDSYQEYHLVGVLMGLAVYNSINLDIRFPAVCYRKLLSPAVVPYNNPEATVGNCAVTLSDFKQVSPELWQGLNELLEYEGDVEEDFCASFQISYLGADRKQRNHDLKAGGANISVTNTNRKEYVDLYCDWMLNKGVYSQFRAFYHGFHSVCASNALIMLRPEEVENLVCGSPVLDVAELKKVTTYDGYKPTDITIVYFWEIVMEFKIDTQKQLLLFSTGSDRIPVGGMSEMQFRITYVTNSEMLPMAHTCFNQLMLPPYKNKTQLKQKLLIAIQNSEGFGME